jgi:hypothetical protein
LNKLPAEKTVTQAQDSDFPRTWRFDEDGLEVVGKYVATDEGPTQNGPCPILVLEVDGEERSVWCFHTALRRRIADEIARRSSGDLTPGETVVIRQGESKTSESGRKYVSYYTRFPEAPKRTAGEIFKADAIDSPPEPQSDTATDEDIPF